MPHFMTGVYRPYHQVQTSTDLCYSANSSDLHNTSETPNQGQDLSWYLALFILAGLVRGFGSGLRGTLLLPFMDDSMTNSSYAVATGLYLGSDLLGNIIGYMVGGAFLTVHTDFGIINPLEDGYVDSDDPRWVGAWWLPFLMVGSISLMFAMPLSGYPTDLPGSEEIRNKKKSEAAIKENLTSEKKEITCASQLHDIKALLSNGCSDSLAVSGAWREFTLRVFASFGIKFFEVQFTLKASTAAMVTGGMSVAAGVAGSVLGGVIIKKLNLSCIRIIDMEIILGFIFMATSMVSLLHCDGHTFVGMDTEYSPAYSGNVTTGVCNMGCGCMEDTFDPICSVDNNMYLSPCLAGCASMTTDGGKRLFYNCSCIAEDILEDFSAISGPCESSWCWIMPLFTCIVFFTVFVSYMAYAVESTAATRCVQKGQKSAAFAIRLLANTVGGLLGPVVCGSIYDANCELWSSSDGQGSCFKYNNSSLGLHFMLMMNGAKACELLFLFLARFFYKYHRRNEKDSLEIIDVDKLTQVQELQNGSAPSNETTPMV